MRRALHRPALDLFLLPALALAACTFWQATETPLPELTASRHPPSLIRVTTVEGDLFELTDPRVHNDTLIGGSVPDTGWTFIAVGDVTKVELKKKNVWKTVGIGAAVAAVVAAIVVLCDDPDACTSDDEEP